jgi:molecular chaperone GrpE (heat shock protein)
VHRDFLPALRRLKCQPRKVKKRRRKRTHQGEEREHIKAKKENTSRRRKRTHQGARAYVKEKLIGTKD